MRLIFTVLFFFQIFSIFSQDQGFVLDKDGIGIEGVKVFFADQSLELYSKNDGSFIIPKSIPENSFIEIKKPGYISKIIQYNSSKKIIFLVKNFF